MSLSGFLLASATSVEITKDILVDHNDDGRTAASIQFRGLIFESRQWEEFCFYSDRPIDEEDKENYPDGPPYPHKMVCVRSGAKILLLAERRRVTDYIIGRFLNRRIFPNLRRVRIHTGKLIESCQNSNSMYSITTLHGSFAGTDRHISKISLYGSDITESSLYREQHHLFNFYSCGLARRLHENLLKLNLHEESEIALVGNDGFISSQISSAERAREVIRVINYIVRNRWVDSWVPDIAMD
jgi:hypothetical protein